MSHEPARRLLQTPLETATALQFESPHQKIARQLLSKILHRSFSFELAGRLEKPACLLIVCCYGQPMSALRPFAPSISDCPCDEVSAPLLMKALT